VRNRDILIGSIAATFAGAITYLAHMAQWAAMFGGGRDRDEEEGGGVFGLIVMAIVAPLAAMLIQMAISRSREYEADAGGAQMLGTGEPLARIRQGNTERILAGVPDSREFRKGEPFAGVHRERQIGVAKQLFSAMGIARDDAAMRQDWVLRGFRQFDAPVCVIVTYDKVLQGSDDTPFDCGGVVNALVNAAWSRGLGTVINSQGIMQSPVVREHAQIREDQVIMKCVAMGYPDDSFPANAVVSNRKSVDEAVTFLGFDD
jgi:hypothetical protein